MRIRGSGVGPWQQGEEVGVTVGEGKSEGGSD